MKKQDVSAQIKPTLTSKVWQNFLSFQTYARMNSEGGEMTVASQETYAWNLYSILAKECIEKTAEGAKTGVLYSFVQEYNAGEMTIEQLKRYVTNVDLKDNLEMWFTKVTLKGDFKQLS